jgi:hypothetical protein
VNTVQADRDLYAFRRHLKTCRFFGPGGREVRADKCTCPFHVDGDHNGQRVRRSLQTRSRQLADRRLAELIRNLDAQLASELEMVDASESGNVPAAATLTVSAAVDRNKAGRSLLPGRLTLDRPTVDLPFEVLIGRTGGSPSCQGCKRRNLVARSLRIRGRRGATACRRR